MDYKWNSFEIPSKRRSELQTKTLKTPKKIYVHYDKRKKFSLLINATFFRLINTLSQWNSFWAQWPCCETLILLLFLTSSSELRSTLTLALNLARAMSINRQRTHLFLLRGESKRSHDDKYLSSFYGHFGITFFQTYSILRYIELDILEKRCFFSFIDHHSQKMNRTFLKKLFSILKFLFKTFREIRPDKMCWLRISSE